MSWNLTEKNGVLILEMNSSKANLHNPEFISDFHEAIDRADQSYPALPIILTAFGSIFSAGIDFKYAFALFQKGDPNEVLQWFKSYSGMMLRLFESPRLTVAALNGHVFAGGMILALCCDFRIAAQGSYQYSINEVPVGIPMPSVYTEIIRFRLGNLAASETILSGEIYNAEQAMRLGLIKKLVAPQDLLNEAIKQAQIITPNCYTAYSHSKNMLQQPALKFIREQSLTLDKETLQKVCAPDSIKAQQEAGQRLLMK